MLNWLAANQFGMNQFAMNDRGMNDRGMNQLALNHRMTLLPRSSPLTDLMRLNAI